MEWSKREEEKVTAVGFGYMKVKIRKGGRKIGINL